MHSNKTAADCDYTGRIVDRKGRKSILTMFMIMLGFTFFSASMWAGQTLANGLDFKGFIHALILGGTILGAYTGTLGFIGAESGLSLDMLAHRSFGRKGSWLPSEMISFTQIGWFGAGLVIGSFVSGGTATPNFSRFARNGRVGAIVTVVAFFFGNSLMFLFGAVSGIYAGGNDIFEVMVNLGLFWSATIVLGLNIWTTNDNALYSSGLGLSNIFGVNKKTMVLLAGIIGALVANLLNWGIPSINGMAVATAVYMAGTAVTE